MKPEERTVQHESGHLAAAVVLDLKPTRAEITPGNPHQGGAVYMRGIAEDIDRDKAHRICQMVLCGPAMGDDELPTWPLNEGASRDERLVAAITSHFGFDAERYEELQDQTWDLTFSRPFKRAFIAAETLLRDRWVIGRQGIAIVEWAAETAEAETERDLELCAA